MIQLASLYKVRIELHFSLLLDFYPLFTVASPHSDVTAVQAGPTSITVSWSPSSDGTGYRIDYGCDGCTSGSYTPPNNGQFQINNLENGKTYIIFIISIGYEMVVLDTVSLGSIYTIYPPSLNEKQLEVHNPHIQISSNKCNS